MNDYIIVTDSCADLNPKYISEHEIVELQLSYTIDGVNRPCDDPSLSRKQFYDLMRAGKMPITAQVNVEDAIQKFIPLLEQGKDLLCIMFSSMLSGTFNSVRIAVEELTPKYPERTLVAIDSLHASAGQGLLVTEAAECRAAGIGVSDAAQRIRDGIPHMTGMFTVDDLNHLHRGGRVSAATAFVGTMLGIKPILVVDINGRLIPTGKVRGRKQSLLALAEGFEKQYDPKRADRFAISHGDCLEDAQFVIEEIAKRTGIKKHTVYMIDPTVGAHAGPGTVALFYYAKSR